MFSKDLIDTDVKVEFLDVSGVHCYTEAVSEKFFNMLSETPDLSLFGHRSVQAIIDFKWPLAKKYTTRMLFVPFCIYLAIFVAWSNAFNGYIYPFDKESWFAMWVADKVLCALLYLFSCYFLQNELRQMYMSGWAYLSSFWNYVDFLPSSLIIAIVSVKLKMQFGKASTTAADF